MQDLASGLRDLCPPVLSVACYPGNASGPRKQGPEVPQRARHLTIDHIVRDRHRLTVHTQRLKAVAPQPGPQHHAGFQRGSIEEHLPSIRIGLSFSSIITDASVICSDTLQQTIQSRTRNAVFCKLCLYLLIIIQDVTLNTCHSSNHLNQVVFSRK